MIKRALCVLAGCFIFTATAVAECSQTGCIDVYVEELYVNAGANVYIQTSGDELLANCTPSQNVFLLLLGSSAQFKEVYATLLAAKLMEKKVTIRVNEGTNPCTVAYVRLLPET